MLGCSKMSRKGSRRIRLNSSINDEPLVSLTTSIGNSNVIDKQKERYSSRKGFSSSPPSSALRKSAHYSALRRYWRLVQNNMSRVLHCFSRRRQKKPYVTQVPPSMTPQAVAVFGDSHRSEVIEDCIIFLNSSSRREVQSHELLLNQQLFY